MRFSDHFFLVRPAIIVLFFNINVCVIIVMLMAAVAIVRIYINCLMVMSVMIFWIISRIVRLVISTVSRTCMRHQRIVVPVVYGFVNMTMTVKPKLNKPTVAMQKNIKIGVTVIRISVNVSYLISIIAIINCMMNVLGDVPVERISVRGVVVLSLAA